VRYNIDVLRVVVENGAVLLPVKVVPGASRSRYMGEWNGRARVAVAAPAERGKANQALLELLAGLLNLDRRLLQVVVGETSPLKTIRIGGITAEAVLAALESSRS
jgi:hypothetical protein